MTFSYDILVVGSGLAGATVARKLADEGLRVLVLERRNHIGGNIVMMSITNMAY